MPNMNMQGTSKLQELMELIINNEPIVLTLKSDTYTLSHTKMFN